MIRVAFLIRSLDAGGAQRQLVQLAANLDKSLFEVTIITSYPGGALAGDLDGIAGVRVISVDKRGRRDVTGFLTRLVRTARSVRPHIVHGYGWGGNELAWFLGRIVRARVVWGIRASDVDVSRYDRSLAVLFRLGAILSSRADLIIVNSEAGRRHHVGLGFSPHRMVVIPNGIDICRFKSAPEAGARLRAEWQVQPGEFVAGIVARLDPMKDHETFLEAAMLLAQRVPSARFLIAGDGPHAIRDHLEQVATRYGVHDRVRWLGDRRDVTAVYSALDVLVSSSAFGEGFSNAIGEAMACEVPCVVTDVGDAAFIVGDTGRVVPRRRPDLLADALGELSGVDRRTLGSRARERVAQEFSLGVLAKRTTAALCGLVAPAPS